MVTATGSTTRRTVGTTVEIAAYVRASIVWHARSTSIASTPTLGTSCTHATRYHRKSPLLVRTMLIKIGLLRMRYRHENWQKRLSAPGFLSGGVDREYLTG